MINVNLPEYPVEPFIEPPPASYGSIERALRKIGPFRLVWGGSATEYWAGFTVMRHPLVKHLVETVEVCPNPEAADPDYVNLPRDDREWTDEQRALYGHLSRRVKRVIYEAGDPYWYVELRLEPEIACAGWNENRHYFAPDYFTADPVTGLVDLKGPEPREGGWITIMKLADEHGQPRAPESGDVEAVRRYQQARLADPDLVGWRHDEATPKEVLARRVERRQRELEAEDERELAEARERIRDIAAFHILDRAPRRSFPSEIRLVKKDTTDEHE